jgi:hypothetical protein
VGEADSGDDDGQDESEDKEKGEEPDAADVEGDEACAARPQRSAQAAAP